MRTLPLFAIFLALPGCSRVYSVRVDVRQGSTPKVALVHRDDLDTLAGPPLADARLTLVDRKDLDGKPVVLKTDPRGRLVVGFGSAGPLRVSFPATERLACSKDGCHPFQGTLRFLMTPRVEQDQTILVILQPEQRGRKP